MGYDVTFHPIALAELQRFLFDIVDRPSLKGQRYLEVSPDLSVRALVSDLYDELLDGLEEESGGWDEEHPFSGNIRMAAAAIAGCLHPYWYARGAALSFVDDVDVRLLFKSFDQVGRGKIRAIGDFDPTGQLGIYENLTASAFIPAEGVQEIHSMLEAGHEPLLQGLGSGIGAVRSAVAYARERQLGLIEAADLAVPGAWCLSNPDNLRASWSQARA